MKHLNFLSKSSSQSCGHSSVTLASTVGSQEEFYVSGGNSRGAFTPADVCQTSSVRLNRFTAHRRGAMLRLLSVLVLVLTIGVGQMWGAKDDVVYKYGGSKLNTSNSYDSYSNTDISSAQTSTVSSASWAVTCGSNQNAGLWLGASSSRKAKMILSNGSLTEASAIASAISTQQTSVTTSSTYYAALIGRTNFSNVYKVNLTYTTPGGTAPSEAWILYSTDNGVTWNVGEKKTSLSSNTNFNLGSTIASARYAFVIHCTDYCQFKVPNLTFYEGSTGTTYNVTYNNGDHGTAPSNTTASSVTLSAITGVTGYTCTGWKANQTVKVGNSDVAANTLINNGTTVTLTAATTFTAQWETDSYSISKTLSHCSASPSIPDNYTYSGSAANLNYTITADEGYVLPSTISVTGTTYSWDNSNGALSLTGTITENVSISISAEKLYTVNFNKGTGTCATTELTGTNTTGITLPTPTHHCDGWSFAGWTTGALITSETTTAPATLLEGGTNYKPTADVTLYAVYKRTESSGGSQTSTLANSSVVSSGNSQGYKTNLNISGWTGKYAVNYVSSGTHYAIQIGRTTTTSGGAYNSHLTSPSFTGGATHISLTLSNCSSQSTANGRKFYLMDSDDLNYTATNQTSSYGVGTYDNSNSNYVVEFDITGNPSQFHIYADGTSYIKSITVTYSSGTTYYVSNPDCCTELGQINGSFF